jgi:hypothetical protein
LKQFDGLGDAVGEALQVVYNGFERLLLATYVLGPFGIVPEVRIFDQAIDFGKTGSLGIEVKETPEVRPRGGAGIAGSCRSD